MKQINMYGLDMTNFGANNYSGGMELIYCYRKEGDVMSIVKKVLNGEMYGVWLNPGAKCTPFEFYGLFGTQEQYKEVYTSQVDLCIAKEVVSRFGGIDNYLKSSNEDWEVVRKVEQQIRGSYVDWWKCI